ncbi:uncharacterized protein STEHIDRAFT_22627, partial [Stereum hirsutum FP-91666 SS1]|uniref:uncharacterized protein n=1 Tax=Stereum hirsutum (strain FP-91666) TaxID=721885 RepID=UPI000440FBD9
QILPLSGSASGTVTSTFGPSSSSSSNSSLSILPQLFLTLRGSSLVIHTSTLSNATANITLSASPSGTTISTTVDTSVGSISAVGLPEDEELTLSLIFV